jgi:5-methylcytosine-specific restriction protein B
MPRYVDRPTLSAAVGQLKGTANVFFRIWLLLKKMGFSKDKPVVITTVNCDEPLRELFWYGDSAYLFTPFTETPSDRRMKADGGRSIVQTNIRQWADKTGTKNPPFLDVREKERSGDEQGSKPLIVRAEENYPVGLGLDAIGFAVKDGSRVSVPPKALAVWLGRTLEIPDGIDPIEFLVENLEKTLNISAAEAQAVFVDKPLDATFVDSPLEDEEIRAICDGSLSGAIRNVAIPDTPEKNRERIQSVQTINGKPSWLNSEPAETLDKTLKSGAKAILLYGPPRTGKTRAVDLLKSRSDADRETIQIHDGWDYEQLIQGLFPKADNTFDWRLGRLAQAVKDGKKFIVLEEINRTLISQSLGEVFSLIEEAYRGEGNGITLRSGHKFHIPEDVVFVMTMNNVDKSTEDIDDALIGRFSCVEFPPRVEDLATMLESSNVEDAIREKLCRIFGEIQAVYPLGHGYFARFGAETDPLHFYKTKIRPVLANHLEGHNDTALGMIDNLVDEVFAVQ